MLPREAGSQVGAGNQGVDILSERIKCGGGEVGGYTTLSVTGMVISEDAEVKGVQFGNNVVPERKLRGERVAEQYGWTGRIGRMGEVVGYGSA